MNSNPQSGKKGCCEECWDYKIAGRDKIPFCAKRNCPCHSPVSPSREGLSPRKRIACCPEFALEGFCRHEPLSPSQEGEYCGDKGEGCMEILCCPNIHDSIRSKARASTLKEVGEEIAGMNEQNEITQAILGALEYRGFYDAEKYLDGSIWERVKPVLLALLQEKGETPNQSV